MLAVLGAMSSAAGEVAAQTEQKSAMTVLRDQASSIAEEILDSLRLAPASTGRVSVSVRGGGTHDIVENAMLEALQRRGVKATLRRESLVDEPNSLHLFVLEQNVVHDASKETAGWNIRTTLEVRVGEEETSRYAGKFSRNVRDTVSGHEYTGSGTGLVGSDSFLEKIIEPLVVVAGAFLIVYLFFTVRS